MSKAFRELKKSTTRIPTKKFWKDLVNSTKISRPGMLLKVYIKAFEGAGIPFCLG